MYTMYYGVADGSVYSSMSFDEARLRGCGSVPFTLGVRVDVDARGRVEFFRGDDVLTCGDAVALLVSRGAAESEAWDLISRIIREAWESWSRWFGPTRHAAEALEARLIREGTHSSVLGTPA